MTVNYNAEKLKPAIDLLRKGGKFQKKGLKLLDEYFAEEVSNLIEPLLVNSPFSYWDISIHKSSEQITRIRNSADVKIISYDETTKTAICKGSSIPYNTSASSCECSDFSMRGLPCKHMYKVAAEYFNADFYKVLVGEDTVQSANSLPEKKNEINIENVQERQISIVLSGRSDNYFDILSMLNKHFKITGSVTSKTDYLIKLDDSKNKKTEKAESLNVQIITLDELLKKYDLGDE